jgi:hypothetical protein
LWFFSKYRFFDAFSVIRDLTSEHGPLAQSTLREKLGPKTDFSG